MSEYDFATCLSSLDFERLSKDLFEAELGISLEIFPEGRDQGIDLRYVAPKKNKWTCGVNGSPDIIIQCKRYSKFSNLKSDLKKGELEKIRKLSPVRYILITSVSLTPLQSDELRNLLHPYVSTTGDIYGRERINSLLGKHSEIERRHVKLWVSSAGVLDSIINATTHIVSHEEVERTLEAAKIYVRNPSFDEALAVLDRERVCIISGQPGIGKTTLARMLLIYYLRRGFEVIKIESDVSEARAVGFSGKPRFYYYDDFLGQTTQADKLNKNEDQKLLDFMRSVQTSKDSVFVLTTREYILNQAKIVYEKIARENFNYRTCIIDLSKYSRRMRAEILYNHLHFSDMPGEYIESLRKSRGYIKIIGHKNYSPRLIHYLTNFSWMRETSPDKYLSLFLQHLDNPVEIWEHAKTHLSDSAQHLLLVLTTLPLEVRLADMESAFKSFCNTQHLKYKFLRSSMDFKNALKELDGTFIATRVVEETVLIRFENPSIRDFMENFLLREEVSDSLFESMVFFEQANWLVDIYIEKSVSLKRSRDTYDKNILSTLRRLLEAGSCSITVSGIGIYSSHRLISHEVNLASRLSLVAIIGSENIDNNWKWLDEKLIELAGRVGSSGVSLRSCVNEMENLKGTGCLNRESGKYLIQTMKDCATNEPEDLDDVEILVGFIKSASEQFTDEEVKNAGELFENFVDWYIQNDIQDVDILREDAVRIHDLGTFFDIDTHSAEQTLNRRADEIDQDNDPPFGGDDDRRWIPNNKPLHYPPQAPIDSGYCSDEEIDSMFDTLE